METSLVFVHGFLGRREDWLPVVQNLKIENPRYFIDLNRDFEAQDLNFQAWPEAFRKWTHRQQITTPIVFVGYSMGGRLVLPLLEKGFGLGAVFLSSHFGMNEDDFQGRTERRLQNQQWAQRFLEDPWSAVIRDWNAQNVLQGSAPRLDRSEENYSRQKLAAIMTGFSVSEQKNYIEIWKRKDLKLRYLVGNLDQKFLDYANRLKEEDSTRDIRIIQPSGHRLLMDQPQLVADEIQDFIKEF